MIADHAGQAVDDGVEHLTGAEDDFHRSRQTDQHTGDQYFFHAVDKSTGGGAGAHAVDGCEDHAQQQIERRQFVVLPAPAI
ncbi:hypothetical protein D9M73_214840 [compost metagenome]